MAEKFDINTVKSMDTKAIIQFAKNIRAEIAGFVLDKNLNKLKDVTVISKKRKELARTLTVLRQKQLLEAFEKTSVKAEAKQEEEKTSKSGKEGKK